MSEATPQGARREQILRAAGELIGQAASAGSATAPAALDSLTMNQIAAQAGLTKATLYRYFRGKADIVAALAARGLDVAAFQPEQRRDLILRAALRTFAKHGLRGATMEQIGQEAGITAAAIYWYFRSKEDLIEAIFENYTALPHLRQLATLPVGDEEAQIRNLANRVLDIFDQRADIIKMVLGASTSRPDLAAEVFEQIKSKLLMEMARYIDRRVEAGIFRPGNSLARAQALISPIIIYTLAHHVFGDAYPLDRQTAIAEFVGIFIHGVAAASPQPSIPATPGTAEQPATGPTSSQTNADSVAGPTAAEASTAANDAEDPLLEVPSVNDTTRGTNHQR